MERLQKVIAESGYCSRRKAEELIIKGKVKVNGEIIKELGTKVDGNDQIMIDGKILEKENKEYILLYKPRGVVTTTSDDKKRKTVLDLIDTDKRLYPVGRLDYDTTGVLLLTNDGELTNLLIHPKNNIDKVYVAKIEGILTGLEIKQLERGVVIDGFKTSPAIIKVRKKDKKDNDSLVQITIHEGKNHQVKKMFEAVGHKVIKLKRERIAFLDLTGLKPGEYRKLNIKEVKKLYGIK
ncbi:MAG: rRNA pseudouridine synthase [Firmicutes bacterium]|nr:rRNA pseudouridine synthase [Bacillota bacterium]